MKEFVDAMDRLKQSEGAVREYALAREQGFVPVQRILEILDGEAHPTLLLGSADGEQKTLASSDPEFLQLWLDHRCVFYRKLEHISEHPTHGKDGPAHVGNDLSVSVTCGLFRASGKQIPKFWVSEQAAKGHVSRDYQMMLPVEVAQFLCPVPAEPVLEIKIKSGGKTVFGMIAHVDQLLPATDDSEETMVGLRGTGGLAGSRRIITAGFNLTSFPGESVLKVGTFLDVPMLKPEASLSAALVEFTKSIDGSTTETLSGRLRDSLEVLQNAVEGPLREHAKFFLEVLGADAVSPLQLVASFLPAAWALEEQLPIAFAVGHVRGIRTEGAIRIAPNTFICTQDSQPVVRQVEKHNDGPLCATWPEEGALLVVLYVADGDAKEMTEDGWTVLRDAFTLLSGAASDTSWLRTADSGEPVVLPVDGKLQDAALELSPHYHVQNLFTKYGHQSYAGVQKVSHELELNDLAVDALRPRMDLLTKLLKKMDGVNEQLAMQLRRAMEWLAKSRNAASEVEQFVCIWIALEYLLVPRGTKDKGGVVAKGISALMGRGDPTAKKWWRAQAAAAYDVRCDVVHDAHEDAKEIARLTPLIRQAAIETIWACVLCPEPEAYVHPAEIVARLEKRNVPNPTPTHAEKK